MKQQFLCLFPQTVTDGVAVHHSVTFVNVTRMSIVILRNGRLQGVSTLITKVTFFWWIMNICQHVHDTFVLPNYCCHVTMCPDPNVAPFHFQCLASAVMWHFVMVWCNCTAAVCICCLSDCYISQEKKTYGHAPLPLYQLFHCSMGCCHVCWSPFSVFL